MKLKQLLISTTSIAALAVVPISIVSCGNNNNNAVEGLPPANGGDNSNPGNGDNNNKPGEDNNNQQPLPPIDEPIYIDVNSRYDMEDYILSDIHIIFALIKQVIPSFNNIMFYFEWKTVPQLAYDSGMWITKDGEYTYYNVQNVKFTFSTIGEVLKYQYVDDQGNKMTSYISGIQSVTVSVDIHFRSTTDFIDGGLGR